MYLLTSDRQNAGQRLGIEIANRTFENMSQLQYLGMRVTNYNLIQADIKRKLNSGNDWYNSIKNILSSRLLSKNMKIGTLMFACGSIWE
jgi:hypothetical protein